MLSCLLWFALGVCKCALQGQITRNTGLLDPFIKFLPSPRLILGSYMHYFKKTKKPPRDRTYILLCSRFSRKGLCTCKVSTSLLIRILENEYGNAFSACRQSLWENLESLLLVDMKCIVMFNGKYSTSDWVSNLYPGLVLALNFRLSKLIAQWTSLPNIPQTW